MAMIIDEPQATASCSDHVFERHIAVKVFGRRGTAWLQPHLISPGSLRGDEVEVWICVICGEWGYEVRS